MKKTVVLILAAAAIWICGFAVGRIAAGPTELTIDEVPREHNSDWAETPEQDSGLPPERAAPLPADAVEETQIPSNDTVTSQQEGKEETKNETVFIVNKKTKKFHYPWCTSVAKMSEENKMEIIGIREDLIESGYTPCQRCHP